MDWRTIQVGVRRLGAAKAITWRQGASEALMTRPSGVGLELIKLHRLIQRLANFLVSGAERLRRRMHSMAWMPKKNLRVKTSVAAGKARRC